MLHRLGWAVGIIIGDVVYLPAIDAAAIVDRLNVTAECTSPAGRDPANRDRCSAVFFPTYSSFLELVKPLREWFAAQPRSGFNPC